ncbi:hypothetical protein HK098_007196 [Nowakowskiella sp. JEL0407]|nr:hypothetical protein HK098_007196 [Nowakowskiella sp. JEL0407]
MGNNKSKPYNDKRLSKRLSTLSKLNEIPAIIKSPPTPPPPSQNPTSSRENRNSAQFSYSRRSMTFLEDQRGPTSRPLSQSTAPSSTEVSSYSSRSSRRLTIDLSIAENWQPQQKHMIRNDARMDQKRRFHNVVNSVYPLPADIEEQDRLELQHILYRYGLNSLFHMPLHKKRRNEELQVLDVGCGPGSWARDVAERFPKWKVWGVDMAQSLFVGVETLENMTFVTGNVLERLPFKDNTFDGVYQRLMLAAIPKDKWDHVISELVRILKPGGFLELCEPDLGCQRMGPNFQTLSDAASDALNARGINMKIPYELSLRMYKAGLRIVSEHTCSFPIGWDGRHGELHLVNAQQGFMGMKPFLCRAFGITADEYDTMVNEAIAECPIYQTYYNAFAVVGRKSSRLKY